MSATAIGGDDEEVDYALGVPLSALSEWKYEGKSSDPPSLSAAAFDALSTYSRKRKPARDESFEERMAKDRALSLAAGGTPDHMIRGSAAIKLIGPGRTGPLRIGVAGEDDSGGAFFGPPVHPSRLDGAMHAFGSIATRNRGTKALVVPTRNDTVRVQSPVVIAVQFNANERKHRMKRTHVKEQLVGPGELADYNVKEGEGVYAIIGYTTGVRSTTVHYPDGPSCFSTVNALAKGEKIVWVGVAQGEASCTDDRLNMTTFTAQIQGSCTMKWLSPGKIRRFRRIAFTAEPMVIRGPAPLGHDDEPGVLMPAIRETGIPDTKHRPTMFEYDNRTLASRAAEIRLAVELALFNHSMAVRPSTASSAYDAAVVAIKGKFAGWDQLNTLQPIELYGRWHAISSIVQFMLSDKKSDEDKITVVKDVRALMSGLLAEEQHFYGLHTKGNMYDIPGIEEATSQRWKHLFAPLTDDSLGIISGLILPSIISEHRDNAFCQHLEWCSTNIIGRAMTSAKPGQDVDICLGLGAGL